MPKKLDKGLEKTSIRLFEGDMATLQSFYPQIGYNAAIRTIVHRHCSILREQESRKGIASDVRTDPAELDGIIGTGSSESVGNRPAGD